MARGAVTLRAREPAWARACGVLQGAAAAAAAGGGGGEPRQSSASHYHLRSWYRRYCVIEGGKSSSSIRESRGFPTACRITRRHRSINGRGSAEKFKQSHKITQK